MFLALKSDVSSRLIATLKVLIMSASIGTLAPNLASSDEAKDTREWQHALRVYLWGASLGGTAFIGQNIDVSFKDLFDNLNFGLMGSYVARRDELALFVDALYLDVSNSANGQLGPVGGVPAQAGVALKGLVATGGVGYNNVLNDRTTLTTFGGVRGLFLDTTLDLNIGPVRVPRTAKPSFIDGVIGIRGRTELSDKWSLTYYADLGAGQSDFTWQVMASVDYRLKKWDLSLGYRHLDWDFKPGKAMTSLSFSGPYIGAIYRF